MVSEYQSPLFKGQELNGQIPNGLLETKNQNQTPVQAFINHHHISRRILIQESKSHYPSLMCNPNHSEEQQQEDRVVDTMLEDKEVEKYLTPNLNKWIVK